MRLRGGMLHGQVLTALALTLLFAAVNARLAVMSIDLGGEFMKIAIVKPGVPMEIVLNKESSRKTPTLVAFRNGERQFGNEAQNTAVKFPAKAFAYLPLIVGRQYDDPQVELFRQRFPYYSMEKDEGRGTVLFRTEDDSLYSVEELLAMILEKAKEYAQDFAEQDIKDAVITVPSFFNQAERRAVLAAAKMVGINVLQLMSDNAAVALNYGVFRRNNFNSTMQYYMFYDMGSTSTTATIVGYNVVKTKEGTRMESNPQVTIKGVGFDRTLGGLEISLRLRKFLAKAFNDQKKTTLKVEENQRAMAKLLKEAERVKKVLSANVDHTAQIEGLLDEKDFRSHVTRAELEHLSEDLFDRLTKPIEDALKISEITLPEINEVILMGGATRMPKVQEILVKFLGRSDLGKSINTDEAAAMGAVYQAAYLGKGFKVKKFGVREGNIYPINVEFERQKTEDSGEPARVIKRTLFGRMNPFPQRKVMTFTKHNKDFGFNVTYASLDFLTEDDRRSFGNLLISKYNLFGVEDALIKNKDLAESKGIKAHFQMDGSGVLSLDRVESVFEKNDTEAEVEKSTWSKLGSAIGGLFGGGGSNDDTKVEDSSETPESGSTGSDGSTPSSDDSSSSSSSSSDDSTNTASESEGAAGENQDENPEETTEDSEGKEEKKPDSETGGEQEKEEKEKQSEEQDKGKGEAKEGGDEKKEKTDKAESKEEKDKKGEKEEEKVDKTPKIVNIKEEIKSEVEIMDVQGFSEEKFKAAKQRLTDLRKADKAKVELEKAQNELEAFIFDAQDKLSQEIYEKCSTPEEKENMLQKLSEASDWLYDQVDAKKSDYTEKLKSLKDLTKAVGKRVAELQERPKALEALRSALNQTTVFLATVKNLTSIPGSEALEGDSIFTPVEVETLEKIIVETRKWRDDTLKAQEKLKDSEDPVLLVDDVAQKISALDREMRYLINKAKNYKPKPKPKAETKKDEGNETSSNATDEKSSKDGSQESSEGDAQETENKATQPEDQAPPPSTDESASAEEDSTKGEEKDRKEDEAQEGEDQQKKPEKDKAEKAEDDGVERTSSGKRRPKQKRKSTQKKQKEENTEPLELDSAASKDKTIDSGKTDSEDTKHTEL
ncbi:hypoxia up-regulated protein 1 [Plakobranchus ocellatus]|uniref:Hypoxia up-regulated protein 1 n=1 Tax=Plakobranchus ocellatus TaxID=259542 RepID=A0AAV4DSF0_9GAST|nr:hypoxia up-regulated protein 1 [Plakobranchus ocellatus]